MNEFGLLRERRRPSLGGEECEMRSRRAAEAGDEGHGFGFDFSVVVAIGGY